MTRPSLDQLARLSRLSPMELRELRRRRGLTQTAFGKLVGLTQGRVSDYERGFDRHDGQPLVIPPALALAARMIARVLPAAGAILRPGRQPQDPDR